MHGFRIFRVEYSQAVVEDSVRRQSIVAGIPFIYMWPIATVKKNGKRSIGLLLVSDLITATKNGGPSTVPVLTMRDSETKDISASSSSRPPNLHVATAMGATCNDATRVHVALYLVGNRNAKAKGSSNVRYLAGHAERR